MDTGEGETKTLRIMSDNSRIIEKYKMAKVIYIGLSALGYRDRVTQVYSVQEEEPSVVVRMRGLETNLKAF